MRYTDLKGHIHKVYQCWWIKIALFWVFMKNLHTKYLEIRGEQPQLKVPMQDLQELSHFFSFSLSEEVSRKYSMIRRSYRYH